MTQKQKKRLCWNCEGSISQKDEVCPYCGVSVRPLALGDTPAPYIQEDEFEEDEEEAHPPYESEAEEGDPSSTKDHSLHISSEESLRDFKIITITIASLLAGMIFFFFGMILLLFAHDGILTISWNGTYWYLYLLIGIPLLIYGWKQLKDIKD